MLPTTPASTVLYLENLVKCQDLASQEQRDQLTEEVKGECLKQGALESIVVPSPPPDVLQDNEPGRVYVKFQEQAGAIAAQRVLHGRIFGGSKVQASFSSEQIYEAVQAGAWPPPTQPSTQPQSVSGVLKMRGLPFSASKQDIVVFFQGCGLQESNVKHVLGRDGRPTGEAYLIFEGPSADMSRALTKHRQILGTRYVELFPSTREEIAQFQSAGVMIL